MLSGRLSAFDKRAGIRGVKMKKLLNRTNGIRGLLLFLYIYIIVRVDFLIRDKLLTGFSKILLPVVIATLLYFVIPFIKKAGLKTENNPGYTSDELPQSPENKTKSKKLSYIKFIVCFVVILGWFLLWFAGVYPGNYSPDSLEQMAQVLNNSYNDWHPVLHTLISFTLPYKIFGTVSSIIICQLVEYSLALAYLYTTLDRYVKNKFRVYIPLVYICVNPATTFIMMFPWKDCLFAISRLVLVTFGFNIYMTGGAWLKKPVNFAVFVAIFCIAQISRHNSILFTLPFLVAVVFPWGGLKHGLKSRLRLISAVAIVLFMIKGPLYSALNVAAPGNRQEEIIGMPMSIIGAVTKHDPGVLDEEMKEFVYKVASPRQWELYITENGYNSVKWDSVDTAYINNAELLTVLKTAGKCIIRSPRIALKGMLLFTDFVWSVNVVSEDMCYPAKYGTPEVHGDRGGNIYRILKTHRDFNRFIVNSPLGYVFSLSVIELVLLIIMISKFTGLGSLKKLLYCRPLYIYNLGTFLLLSGRDYRFFYYTLAVAPVMIVFMLLDTEEPQLSDTEKKFDGFIKKLLGQS